MSENFDLKDILESWPYDPNATTRVVELSDTRTVIQVRLPFGIEQFERDRRPDGKRPHNCESLLDCLMRRQARAEAQGKGDTFRLSRPDCSRLFEEGVLYYHRYLRLFEMQDWERVVRDTARNISLFDFVRKFAAHPDDREYLEQWRPYILRINAVSKVMMSLQQDNYNQALTIATRAIARIRKLPEFESETFSFERDRSLEVLEELVAQVKRTMPIGELELLEREMARAIGREEYELAAELRDRIRSLKGKKASR